MFCCANCSCQQCGFCVGVADCAVSLNPPPDGNCLFSAISDQLKVCTQKDVSAASLRRDITEYLFERREMLTLFDGGIVRLSEKVPQGDVVSYLHEMSKPGTFRDHIMILAACCLFSVQFIILFTLGDSATVVVSPNKDSELVSDLPTLLLGHYSENHGHHYVSLSRSSKGLLPNTVESHSPGLLQSQSGVSCTDEDTR